MPQDQPQNPSDKIAIIGIGCLFPGAQDLESYWANIRDGVDAITATPESHWKPEDYFDADPSAPDKTYGRRGGFLDALPFDPMEFGISPRDLQATDTSQLLGLYVAKQALEDAGYPADRTDLDRDRVSVVLGVTGTLELVIPLGARLGHPIWKRALADAGVDPETAEDVCTRIGEGYVPWQENSFPGLLGNVVAGRIANRLDLHGTNCVVDAACASSLSAVHLAMLELQAGRSDMVVTGGVDTFNDIFMYMCFSKTPALSPTGDARPFAEQGDGTILGEGVGMVVLKRLADAERDGDRIYAVVSGMGTASDGKGDAVYAPSADGQARCLRDAYRQADVPPETVELVEAHGTGTKVGDATEIRGLTSVYQEADADRTWCALGSVKSMIGHTKAAAGAAGLIKAALALHRGVLPPTLKVDQPNDAARPGQTPFYINTEARPWIARPDHPRRAGVSAFGFGGSNFHCVLEEHVRDEAAQVDWDGRVQLFAFSAADRAGITEQLQSAIATLAETTAEKATAPAAWFEVRGLAARSRSRFDLTHGCRLTVVVAFDDAWSPLESLRNALEELERQSQAGSFQTPRGAAFGTGPADGTVGLVFPGQGSQYPGMLRDLACRFPAMRDTLRDAERAASLTDAIYPHPAFDAETRRRQADALRATDVAQPAIGAVSLGAFEVLRHFGVHPAAAAGHSYGELTALCAAGRITPEEFHRLSQLRGDLMAAAGSEGAEDAGSMLAVLAERPVVEAFLARHGLDLVLANRNAPAQFVLSGPTEIVQKAAKLAAADGLRGKELSVAAAFHSPLVAAASEPFGKSLRAAKMAPAAFPVFANTTGDSYPTDPAVARALLAGQLAAPVEFQRCIESMRAAGVSTFVEVGPGKAMSGLVREILGEGVASLALDATRSGIADLARVLGVLAARGHQVELTRFDPDFLPRFEAAKARKKPAFTVPINGANVRPQPSKRPPTPARRTPTAAPSASTTQTSPAPSSPAIPNGAATPGHLASHPSPPATPRTPVAPTPPNPSHPAAPAPAFAPSDPGAMADQLQALMRIQEQTATLHQQFLATQAQAAHNIQLLLTQRLGVAAPAMAPSPTAPVRTAPTAAAATSAPAPTAHAPAPDLAPAVREQVAQDQAPPAAGASTPSTAVTAEARAHCSAVLLSVVADKTGYPSEMLELSMGLDADLGIDSIKRVEILSALQEKLPDAPVVKPEHLGELLTLGHIVDFLSAPAATPTGVPVSPAGTATGASGTAHTAGPDRTATTEVLLAIVADKTGYPSEMLDLSMGLDADLGIDSIKRVEILSALQEKLPDAPVVKPEHLGELLTLGHIVDFLSAPAATPTGVPVSPAGTATGASGTAHTAGPDRTATTEVLLAIVADKTGYPTEMLDLSMGLDADLGIDSIKRVEILSALQEKLPDAPVVKPEHLGELLTLGHIVDFLSAPAATPTGVPVSPAGTATGASGTAHTAGPDRAATTEVLLAIVADKTGYPTEMLELSMGLDADLGIDSIKRVEILSALQEKLPDAPVVKPEHLGELLTLGHIVDFLSDASTLPATTPTTRPAAEEDPGATILRHVLRRRLLTPPAEVPSPLLPESVVWVTATDDGLSTAVVARMKGLGVKAHEVELAVTAAPPADLAGLVILAPTSPEPRFLHQAFTLTRHAGARLRDAGEASCALFATVSRLDGSFGTGELSPDQEVLTGGLAGLAKTVGHEWPRVQATALDIAASESDVEWLATRIVGQLFTSAPGEFGIHREGTTVLELEEQELAATEPAVPFTDTDVVVITGGARGVTAEVAATLARAGAPRLVLLGRSPAPTPEPDWLRTLEDETSIKQQLLSRAESKMTPKELGAAFAKIQTNREVLRNIARMEAAGSRVAYVSVDVRDPDQVAACVQQQVAELGPITGLIHGAGVLADSYIADKSDADFDRVFGTKVEGLANLLAATRDQPLRALVTFASSTARFGRTGQADYAVANEVLNKIAQREQRRRPDCRVLSINWGPWNGGMVTPGLRSVFANEGISVIDLTAGAQYLAQELARTTDADVQDLPVEIVILGGGSRLPEDERLPVLIPALDGLPELPTVFERELTVADHEFLQDHVMNGRAVLPTAMIIEWLGHGALHGNPGLRFCGFDGLKIFKGLTLGDQEAIRIRVCADKARKENGHFAVDAELCSTQAGRRHLHARATMILATHTEAAPEAQPAAVLPPYERAPERAYSELLFHGPTLHGLREIGGCDERGIIAVSKVAPAPKEWMDQPVRNRWIADPLVLDASFQMLILWAFDQRDIGSLPTEIQRYRQFVNAFPKDGTRIEARVTSVEASRALADIDWLDARGVVVARMTGYQCVLDASLRDAFARNELESRNAARR